MNLLILKVYDSKIKIKLLKLFIIKKKLIS